MICGKNSTCKWLALGLALFLWGASSVQAAFVGLVLEISAGLYQSDGITPLADGSIVYVVATQNVTPAGPVSVGGGIIANSTQSGEMIVATIVLNSATYGDPPNSGTHSQSWAGIWPENFNLYLRFFDHSTEPIAGDNVDWGQTDVFNPWLQAFGFDFFDVDQPFTADQTSTFVVIPEPGTMNLLLIAAALICGWVHVRKGKEVASVRASVERFDRFP